MRSLRRGLALSGWPPVRLLFAVKALAEQFLLTKGLIVAGLLVIWLSPSAKAAGIYWTNSDTSIGLANLNGTGANKSLFPAPDPFGLTVDGTYVYWANPDTDSIGRAKLNGMEVNLDFITGVDQPLDVAVNGTYIYWTQQNDSIGRANLNGTGVNQSFITGLSDAPYGLTVDGTYIYWANFSAGTIGRANLDGTGVNQGFIIGADPAGAPLFGIKVDQKYIYWGDINSNRIARANLNGTGVNLNYITGANSPYGIAIDGTYIYWANTGTIGRANLDGTGVNQSFISAADAGSPIDIAVSLTAATVMLDWVPVGNPGNAADTASNCIGANCGSVPYIYFISEYDVTNAQYTEFLNAVDPGGSNTLGLWNTNMQTDPYNGGISFVSGNPSGSKYVVNVGFANDPVVYVTFYSALRFANWLNNGQGSGSTETGAYTLLGGTPTPSNGLTVTRNPGAVVALPSENEWYKAAYYNPATSSYFAYPARTSTPTVCAAPGATPNTANCTPGGPLTVTNVGAYPGSASPYGTFDQGGNVYQWNEQIGNGLGGPGTVRGLRGGAFVNGAGDLAASAVSDFGPSATFSYAGFRVVTFPDTDGDGILDPYDNCPYTANPDQKDSGGIGTGSAPDGIGDACQCGDVTGDGIVDISDKTILSRSLAGLSPYGSVGGMPGFNKCDVTGDGLCNLSDKTVISRALAGLAPGIQQKCAAAIPH